MQFSISVKGDRELSRALRGYNEKIRKGLMQEVAKTTYYIDDQAKTKVPTGATSYLRRSITPVVQDLAGTVSVNAKYGTDVERGQKPGTWPNKDDLMYWVRKKLKVPKNKLKGITYLISRKIHDKGTDAQPFFEPAVKKGQRKFFLGVKRLLANTKL